MLDTPTGVAERQPAPSKSRTHGRAAVHADLTLSLARDQRAHATAAIAAALGQAGWICSPAEIAADAALIVAASVAVAERRTKRGALQLRKLARDYCFNVIPGGRGQAVVRLDICGSEAGLITLVAGR